MSDKDIAFRLAISTERAGHEHWEGIVRAALFQSRKEERERITKIAEEWLHTDTLKLRAGEMTAQEVRTVKAVISAIIAEIQQKAI